MSFGKQPRALLIDVGFESRESVRRELELLGLTVDETSSARDDIHTFDARGHDVVFLELDDEISRSVNLCHVIRTETTVPIIALVPRDRIGHEDAVIAAGADDYVTVPVNPRILGARVAHQLGRHHGRDVDPLTVLSWGALSLDVSQHVFTVAGTEVTLTPGEHRLVALLMSNPRRVFSRGQIADAMGSYLGDGSGHSIDAHVSRVRKKIRDNGGHESISVVRGIGFRLDGGHPSGTAA